MLSSSRSRVALRIGDALLRLACRCLHILACERRDDELADSLVKARRPVLILSVDSGCFEQRFDIADRVGCHLELFHQASDDVLLKGAAQHDVENADARMLGRQALYASDALLDDHRVPGQVVVDQHIGDLKVDALGSGFGRHDDVAIRGVLSEARDGLLIARARRCH